MPQPALPLNRPQQPEFPALLASILGLLAAGIAVAGYLHYAAQKRSFQQERDNQLTAIAELKVSQIAAWRRERVADGEFIRENPIVIEALRRFLSGDGPAGLRRKVLDWMAGYKDRHGYVNLALVDGQGRLRLSLAPPTGPMEAENLRLASAATDTRRVILSDLHRDAANSIHLDLCVPIDSAGSGPPLGALLMQIDPRPSLDALVQSWPIPSATAETLLLRREGDEVVYLTELRHRHETALALRRPVQATALTVLGRTGGSSGIGRATDYRGVSVVAAIRPVPESNWMLVAKVDTEEIYGPIRQSAETTGLIGFLVLAASCTGILLLWRHQQALFYRRQYAAEIERRTLQQETYQAAQALHASDVRFDSFMNHSPALAFIKDEDGRLLYMNNTCEQVWNTTWPECRGKLDSELWPAGVAERLRAEDLAVLRSGQASRVQDELALRDGRAVQMLSFRFPFTGAAGRRLLGGVSVDISEQVRTQRALSAAVSAKEVLLREVHHRVKNNLQVISSLLSMQAEAMHDPAVARALDDTQRRVQCMALIHERLNREETTDRLDFREYAEALARDLFYARGADSRLVALRLQLDPVALELNQAVPCGLILNELLTNSLKYAFPDGRTGEIVIGLRCDEDDRVRLQVADNGIGLPAGLDWRHSQSLGLRIVGILSRQLDGSIEQTRQSPGTAFALTFRKWNSQALAANLQARS